MHRHCHINLRHRNGKVVRVTIQVMIWGRWSLPSTSPVTIKAVTLTNFPFQWGGCNSGPNHLANQYSDVTMSTLTSVITGISTVCLAVYLDQLKRKLQSPRYWFSVRGIHRWPVDAPNKGPVTRNDDFIMINWSIVHVGEPQAAQVRIGPNSIADI